MKNSTADIFLAIKNFLLRIEMRVFGAIFLAIFLAGATAAYFVYPPRNFPHDGENADGANIVEIPEGAALSQAAAMLAEKHIIRSATVFEWVSRFSPQKGKIIAGEYLFPEPVNVWKVAARLENGDFGIPKVKITFPEGFTALDIAEEIKKAIPDFDAERFALIAQGYEGYLFPDTYFFSERVTPEKALDEMLKNFNKQFAPLAGEVILSGRTENEILAMASIIEREAWDPEARRIISGILWKRLRENIPLQVDAPFEYINGKNTFELSRGDLRTDSPFNTYRYRGLPPTAIANPGLDAISAALHPVDSPYYYYLSDRDGGMHYAEDFDGHKANKRKYLN